MKKLGVGRLAAEFVVIVVGVLLALAADRWNQGRADSEAESVYLARLAEEIRGDSTYMERVSATLIDRRAALDSLMAFVNGSDPPADLRWTILVASSQIDLPPPNVWRELEASSSLNILRSAEVRQRVASYYRVEREARNRSLTRAQERGRDPFFDAVYRMGLLVPAFTTEGTPVTPIPAALAASPPPSRAIEAFRDWPEIRRLIAGLESFHFFQAITSARLIESAGATLRVLEGARRE